MDRTVMTLDDHTRVPLEASNLGGDVDVVLGAIYRPSPDGRGRERIEFRRGKTGHDWFIWSATRQQRLASYRTRRALEDAWADWTASYSPVPVVQR